MKAFKCEMCGSNDLLKESGLYVCQHCGTKYSTEEARKLMVNIDGIVEITGTVSIDNKNKIPVYLENAKNAITTNNMQDAVKYYSLILEEQPNHIEAFFMMPLCSVVRSLNFKDTEDSRKILLDSLNRTILELPEKINPLDINSLNIIPMFSENILNIVTNPFQYHTWIKDDLPEDDKQVTENWFPILVSNFMISCEKIIEKIASPQKSLFINEAIIKLFSGIQKKKNFYDNTSEEHVNAYNSILTSVEEAHKGIHAIDSTHKVPSFQRVKVNYVWKAFGILYLIFALISILFIFYIMFVLLF